MSSNKPAEGTPSLTLLIFTAANYDQSQTVTATGKDDAIDDDDQSYAIVLGAATSADASYAGLDPADVALTNQDDDTAGVLVSMPQPTAQTTEAGGTTTFTVRLASQPTADVTIAISSSKPGEGKADLAQVVFTAGDWNIPKTVTVSGQDDAIDDGNIGYSIVLGEATSADAKYAAIDPGDVALTNVDNDTAGLVVSAPSPTNTTTEGGGQLTFTVSLQSEPLANVTVAVVSKKPTEGKPDQAQLVFTAADWNVGQTVTVTGQPDGVDDGDQLYDVTLGPSTSGDPLYLGLTGTVALLNIDACGNGTVDVGEQCDDSNANKCDGCESCERRCWLMLPPGASATVAGITAALPRGSMCVEAWGYVGPPSSGDAIIASSYGAGNNGAFLLRCQNIGAVTGRLVFAHETGGTVVQATADGTACADGKWHHFAGCRSVVGATVTNTVFLDGVLKATGAGAVTTIGANAALVFGGVTCGADGLVGAVDEVRISSVVRYTVNFSPARRLVSDVATLGLWHLDEGVGTTFSDSSGNAYDGTLGAGAGWALDTGYTLAVCQ